MKKFNRILSILLALVMVFTILPATVLAEGKTDVLEGGLLIGISLRLTVALLPVAAEGIVIAAVTALTAVTAGGLRSEFLGILDLFVGGIDFLHSAGSLLVAGI